MTDNEIIKALECCVSNTGIDACINCPFNELKICEKDYCGLEKLALDLINRQKAEIEEQQSEIAILKDSNINLQELYYAEKEKVKKAKQKAIDIAKALQTKRTEAIKEFAKRLQAKAQFSEDFGDAAVSYDDIDGLVKEMTE